jgi:hypothetical protein
MQEQNNRQQSSNENPGKEFANKNHGPQGVDKAPGKEPSQDIENVVAQTQKGKNKVDGDPEKENDRPIENE